MPMLSLALDLPGNPTFTAPVGTPIDITLPEDLSSDRVTVTPSVFLLDTFSNSTGILATSHEDISALSVSFPVLGTLGPVLKKSFSQNLGTLDVFDKSWQLRGFKPASLERFDVVATPEPGTILQFGLGSLLLIVGSSSCRTPSGDGSA